MSSLLNVHGWACKTLTYLEISLGKRTSQVLAPACRESAQKPAAQSLAPGTLPSFVQVGPQRCRGRGPRLPSGPRGSWGRWPGAPGRSDHRLLWDHRGVRCEGYSQRGARGRSAAAGVWVVPSAPGGGVHGGWNLERKGAGKAGVWVPGFWALRGLRRRTAPRTCPTLRLPGEEAALSVRAAALQEPPPHSRHPGQPLPRQPSGEKCHHPHLEPAPGQAGGGREDLRRGGLWSGAWGAGGNPEGSPPGPGAAGREPGGAPRVRPPPEAAGRSPRPSDWSGTWDPLPSKGWGSRQWRENSSRRQDLGLPGRGGVGAQSPSRGPLPHPPRTPSCDRAAPRSVMSTLP